MVVYVWVLEQQRCRGRFDCCSRDTDNGTATILEALCGDVGDRTDWLLLSSDHLHSPAYLHLHSPAAYPHQHSSIGFISPFSRQIPGLRILDCLSYLLHYSQLQPIVHTVDLAMLR